MSRIGKRIITIPEKVTVTQTGDQLAVKGPKGELKLTIHPRVAVKIENNEIHVSIVDNLDKFGRSLWGTFGSHIKNMVVGVTDGYVKELEINGVGFNWEVVGQKVNLKIGFSHPVVFDLPAGVTAKSEKSSLTITGIDKEVVGQVAAKIRSLKKPEPYKGKGIKYRGEVLRKKAGKQAATASAS